MQLYENNVNNSHRIVKNDHINLQCDNFTFISSKGNSVVKNLIKPHDCLQYCLEFKVKTMRSIICEFVEIYPRSTRLQITLFFIQH